MMDATGVPLTLGNLWYGTQGKVPQWHGTVVPGNPLWQIVMTADKRSSRKCMKNEKRHGSKRLVMECSPSR